MNAAPQRILMTADTVGGVWTFAMELAAALEPRGIEIALATMGAPLSTAQRREVARASNVALFEGNHRLEWMDEPWHDVDLAGEWLLEIASQFEPDVIHLNGYSHAALAWNAPVLLTAHSCVRSWWRAVKGVEAPAEYDEYTRRVLAGLQAADMFVAPTQAMLELIRREYAIEIPGRVVPNAVRHDDFAPAPKRPLIFAAGRVWDEAKNLAMLDHVAAEVTWPIQIAGDAFHPNGRKIHLHAAISLGRLSRAGIAQKLATAAIYVLPARYEPFGLSPLEAALSGCALVLGDTPSLREVWQDAAVFVPPDDPDVLTRTLEALIDNTPHREEFGLRARARALQFRPEKMADEYLQAYRDCLDRKMAEVAA